MKLKGVYILMCIFLLALPLVLSQPPQTNINVVATIPGIIIEYPDNEYYLFDNDIELNYHVHNSSYSILDNSTTQCLIHIFNNTGEHIITNHSLSYDDTHNDFFYRIKANTLNRNEEYKYLLDCNNSQEAGFVSVSFTTISNMKVSRPEGEAILLVAIIFLPLIFGIFLLVGAVTLGEEHGVLRIALYLLALLTILASMHFAMVGAVNYLNLPELENFIGTTVFWISVVFFTIVSYWMIYFITKLFQTAAQEKEEKLEY